MGTFPHVRDDRSLNQGAHMSHTAFRLILIGALLFGCAVSQAQQEITLKNLSAEIDSGRVALGKIKGTGGSSGPAIDAELTNTTNKEIQLDITLDEPLYLTNQGVGQNMFVLGVVTQAGGYMIAGSKAFIRLPAKKKVRVMLLSYCADFEKENPAADESFAVGQVEDAIKPVLGRIAAYQRKHPERDITRAAQVAIWMARGEDPDAILKKFRYSRQDLKLAKDFVGTPPARDTAP
jgi:hypothetical protein